MKESFGFFAESQEFDAHTESRKRTANPREDTDFVRRTELESQAAAEWEGAGGEDENAAFTEAVGFGKQHAGTPLADNRDTALRKVAANGLTLIDSGRCVGTVDGRWCSGSGGHSAETSWWSRDAEYTAAIWREIRRKV